MNDAPPGGGRHRDLVIGILGSEQRLAAPVEADAIEEAVIGVAALFHALSAEVDRARPLADVHDGLDVAIGTRESRFELPGGETEQVQMNPALPLRPPDQVV